MNNTPLLSIVLYLHHAVSDLDSTLSSLVKLDKNKTEIILILDNPSEEVNKTLELFLNINLKNVSYLINKNTLGMSFSFNSAIKLARGKYIHLLSSNNEINKNIIQTIEKNLCENKEIDVFQVRVKKENELHQLQTKEFTELDKDIILSVSGNHFSGLIFRKAFLIKNDIKFDNYNWYPMIFLLKVIKEFKNWKTINSVNAMIVYNHVFKYSYNIYDYLTQIEFMYDFTSSNSEFKNFKSEIEYWMSLIIFFSFFNKVEYSFDFDIRNTNQKIKKNISLLHLLSRIKRQKDIYIPNFLKNEYVRKLDEKILSKIKLIDKALGNLK